MEFKELIEKRRSIRKFSERAVPREVVDRILHETLSAPSARNTRTTRLVVVDDPVLVARMADMRDYGSAFMKGAPAGDRRAGRYYEKRPVARERRDLGDHPATGVCRRRAGIVLGAHQRPPAPQG